MNRRAVRHVVAVVGVAAAVATVLPAAAGAAATAGHLRPAARGGRLHAFGIPAGQPQSAEQQLVTAVGSAPDALAASRVWLRREARAALAQFAPGATVASSSSGREAGNPLDLLQEILTPVGDLAGNGHRDVLDTRVSQDESTVAITARDATTGRPLWRRVSHGLERQVLPLSASRVGPSGDRGLLVVKLAIREINGGAGIRVAESVSAWSGKTGKTQWTSRPLVGTLSFSKTSATIHNLPSTPEVFRALPGRPLDVLLPASSFSLNASGTSSPSTTIARLVSGRTGHLRSPYPALTSPYPLPPTLQTVGDLSGDGLGDIVAVSPRPSSAVVTAFRGDTGATLWTRRHGIDPFAFPVPVGRVSGGRVGDLAMEGFVTSLLRGSTGKILWTRPGGDVIPLRAKRPGRPGLVALAREFGRGSLLTRHKATDTRGVEIQAITASNHVAWHRRVAATVHTTVGRTFGSTQVYPIGAVRSGGASGIAVRESITAGLTYVNKEGVIDGDTGKFRSGTIGSPAAGSLVHGRGADLLHTSATPDAVDLSGYDGATGDRIMHVFVPTPGFVLKPLASGMRATGHDCSDIALGGLYTHHRVVVYMLSGSGAPLWSLQYGEGRAVGGRLTHFTAPQHFCAG